MNIAGIKQRINRFLHPVYRPNPDVTALFTTLGNENACFPVVLPQLDSNSTIYSFGVGEDVSFDLAVMAATNAKVYAFDPTPRCLSWVSSQELPPSFIMEDVGLAAEDGSMPFRPPVDAAHVSFTVLGRPETEEAAVRLPVKRLATIMREHGHSRLDVLKMDIEGAEYEVLEDMLNSGIRPKQLLVEFHHRFPGVGLERTKETVASLKLNGYSVFSVSASGEEWGFMHNVSNT